MYITLITISIHIFDNNCQKRLTKINREDEREKEKEEKREDLIELSLYKN